MDWDLRASAWDLTELGREDDIRLSALVGSSSLGGQNNKGEFSVDLNLGRLGDLGDGSVDKLKDPRRASTIVPSSSGSSKRTRALNGTQNVSCLVDGCKSDLSHCREYHRRHRVCERHSKTPIVIVGGAEQRFCQQCSRFHSLGEFDEVKRSCRKRLDGHNRRRRKPQPESLYMSSGSFLSNHQGTRLLQFSSPQIYATTTVCSPTWPGVAKSEEEAMLHNHHRQLHVIDRQSPFPNSFSCSYNGGDKQFSFLPVNDPKIGNQAASEVSVCQQLLNTIASSESGRGRQKLLSDGLTRSVASDCALSLLSTHPSQTLGISSSHLTQPGVTPPVQPLGMGLHFNCLAKYTCSQGMADEAVDPVLISDASNTNIHCNGMFHVEPDGFQKLGPHEHLHLHGNS